MVSSGSLNSLELWRVEQAHRKELAAAWKEGYQAALTSQHRNPYLEKK
jgi:hypothetical protein